MKQGVRMMLHTFEDATLALVDGRAMSFCELEKARKQRLLQKGYSPADTLIATQGKSISHSNFSTMKEDTGYCFQALRLLSFIRAATGSNIRPLCMFSKVSLPACFPILTLHR